MKWDYFQGTGGNVLNRKSLKLVSLQLFIYLLILVKIVNSKKPLTIHERKLHYKCLIWSETPLMVLIKLIVKNV